MRLTPRAFALLRLFLEHAHHVFTKVAAGDAATPDPAAAVTSAAETFQIVSGQSQLLRQLTTRTALQLRAFSQDTVVRVSTIDRPAWTGARGTGRTLPGTLLAALASARRAAVVVPPRPNN